MRIYAPSRMQSVKDLPGQTKLKFRCAAGPLRLTAAKSACPAVLLPACFAVALLESNAADVYGDADDATDSQQPSCALHHDSCLPRCPTATTLCSQLAAACAPACHSLCEQAAGAEHRG